MKKIVAITNCPTGIAHTYMGAENLIKYAKEFGYEIKVETQGAIGPENVLTKDEIKEAEYVILALGKNLPEEEVKRFDGKKILRVDVGMALKNPKGIFEKLPQLDDNQLNDEDNSVKWYKNIFQHIMNGLSYMMPFIASSGMLLGLSLAFGGEINEGKFLIPESSVWWFINQVASTGLQLSIGAMGGFIANSIAGKSALAPAFIASMIANNVGILEKTVGIKSGAGFLGAIIIGVLGGLIVNIIKKIKLPKSIQPIVGQLFIPLITMSVLIISVRYAIAPAIGGFMGVLNLFLQNVGTSSVIVIAIIIGIMVASDLGGPINKTAVLFATGIWTSTGILTYRSMVGLAASMPPLAYALSTFIMKNKYTEEEKAEGITAFIGSFFAISETAISPTLKRPVIMVISNMIGAISACIITGVFNIERIAGPALVAPFIPGLVNKPIAFIIAYFAAGSIGALSIIILTNLHERFSKK